MVFSPHGNGAASEALACHEVLRHTHEACDASLCAAAGVPLAFAVRQSQHKETGRKAYQDQPRGGACVPARGVATVFFLEAT
jgi:hypothetical protein